MYRETYAVTHRGDWDLGTSLAYLQYEKTRNSRISEGLAGGTEGIFSSSNFNTSVLRDLTAHGELSLPLHAGVDQVLTVGTEWVEQQLDDPSSNVQTTTAGGSVPGWPGATAAVRPRRGFSRCSLKTTLNCAPARA